MSATDKSNLVDIVNKQVANWTVLYTKLHNFHWNVKGHHFFVLHEKFEELYNEAAVHIDELAERLLAIEGNPVATMKESLEKATIKEAQEEKEADRMVQSIVDDFTLIIKELKEGVQIAESSGDDGTADMFVAISQLRKA